MAITEGSLGEWKYQHEHRRGYGSRINWHNPPLAGAELLTTFDEPVMVDEIGMAGMVVCTRKSDGHQLAAFPWDLKVPNAEVTG
ncbi:MAG: hypothetical protein AB1513_09830 [Pseudomonadota bacterium]